MRNVNESRAESILPTPPRLIDVTGITGWFGGFGCSPFSFFQRVSQTFDTPSAVELVSYCNGLIFGVYSGCPRFVLACERTLLGPREYSNSATPSAISGILCRKPGAFVELGQSHRTTLALVSTSGAAFVVGSFCFFLVHFSGLQGIAT